MILFDNFGACSFVVYFCLSLICFVLVSFIWISSKGDSHFRPIWPFAISPISCLSCIVIFWIFWCKCMFDFIWYWNKDWDWDWDWDCYTTGSYKGDPRPRIPPHVMASSAIGPKLGVFGFLLTTHAKRNAFMIFVHHAVFYTCLSSCSDHSRCR